MSDLDGALMNGGAFQNCQGSVLNSPPVNAGQLACGLELSHWSLPYLSARLSRPFEAERASRAATAP